MARENEKQAAVMKYPTSFDSRIWNLGHGRSLELGLKSRIMGVVNVTPDSFSDGGQFDEFAAAKNHAHRLIGEGADILDVGGESTRPNADPVTPEVEQGRILPLIDYLATHTDTLISVDTYNATTAALAVQSGAHIINDIWGVQRDPQMAQIAAETGSGICIMHNGREREILADVIDDQILFLTKSLEIAASEGIASANIVVDPGFGFAKEIDSDNLQLLDRLEELHQLQHPIMVGTSRKRFIGSITGQPPLQRGVGTAATSVVARMKGAMLFRVHDVAENHDALAIADALIASRSRS